MEFIQTKFNDVWLIEPKVFTDHRGFFLESFSQKEFADNGIAAYFVQDNHSKSVEKGVLRGLHFQKPPHAQCKIVRITKGAVYDVIVDLRKSSPTYGQWQGFELSENNFRMLLVPQGFAHGFCTLEPDTEMIYKVNDFYAPECDSGIIWNDPTLNIGWPVENPILSDKDARLGNFKGFVSPFE
ncbi:MAG: dTDP-4-dehydrorhamnose 3,5-epimerase [Chitinivibrionales bacterium]|nr:dTDP-4-dehydrorhamnose 3,5-epimerase [Chitinivibrionales bacterium]